MTNERIMAELESATLRYGILEHFGFTHLPESLQSVSRRFAILACEMAKTPRNAETSAGLRKLMEAKDCFVRAARVAARQSEE